MTVVEFLLARCRDREQRASKDIWVADQATAGERESRYGHNLPHSEVEVDGQTIARYTGGAHEADAMLAQRFKPANVRERAQRALAGADAMRRIVELHDGPHACHTWHEAHREMDAYATVHAGDACSTLLLLALADAHHPDYDPAWRVIEHLGGDDGDRW